MKNGLELLPLRGRNQFGQTHIVATFLHFFKSSVGNTRKLKLTICPRLKWWRTTLSFLGSNKSQLLRAPSTPFSEASPYFPPCSLSKYVLKCEIARDGADFEGCWTPGHSNPVFVLAPTPPQLCWKPTLPSRRIKPAEMRRQSVVGG